MLDFKNLDQNKSFLKKESERLGISPTSAYKTYYSRMLLEKISKINYGTLVVKGSFSQYVHLKELTRPVLDIDLSSTFDHNISLELLYRALYEASDDIINFELTKCPYTTPNGVYKMLINATIKYPNDYKKMIIPIGIDFKENNNAIFEIQYKPVIPLFKGDNMFFINIPSFEEHIAEKLYIILHNRKTDTLNTRIKDFYDIYKLHGKDYDSEKFSLYFAAMLLVYKENLENLNTDYLNNDFIDNHSELWTRMQQKYEFMDKSVNLPETVYYTKAVLNEQLQKLREGNYLEMAHGLIRNRQC